MTTPLDGMLSNMPFFFFLRYRDLKWPVRRIFDLKVRGLHRRSAFLVKTLYTTLSLSIKVYK